MLLLFSALPVRTTTGLVRSSSSVSLLPQSLSVRVVAKIFFCEVILDPRTQTDPKIMLLGAEIMRKLTPLTVIDSLTVESLRTRDNGENRAAFFVSV